MAYIIVPSRRGWTQQPVGPLELDSDALAVILPSTGSRYGASPEGVPLSSTNRIVTEHGVALGRTTGGWGLGQRYFSGCAPSDDVTLLTVAWSKSASVSSRWPASVAQFGNALSYGIEFGTGTAATVRLRAYLAGSTRYVGGNIPIPTVPTTIVARHKYGEQTLWVGGEKDSNEGTFNGPSSGFAYIGAYSGAAFDYVLMTAFWKRAISDDEIQRYTDNPWQIFRPRRQISYFDMGASSSIYTLTAQKGSYSITGQSATVLKHKLLTAQAGSYSYTGNTTNITYTPNAAIFTLTAQTGAYAINGKTATISRNRILSAQTGTYTFNGVSADITHVPLANVYNLIAEGGSYTISGINANISRNRRLSTTAGNYQVLGNNATILKSKRLSAQTGIYTYTGQSINISSFDPGANTLVKYINVLTGEILILRPI